MARDNAPRTAHSVQSKATRLPESLFAYLNLNLWDFLKETRNNNSDRNNRHTIPTHSPPCHSTHTAFCHLHKLPQALSLSVPLRQIPTHYIYFYQTYFPMATDACPCPALLSPTQLPSAIVFQPILHTQRH